jgi:hypothetical protein
MQTVRMNDDKSNDNGYPAKTQFGLSTKDIYLCERDWTSINTIINFNFKIT